MPVVANIVHGAFPVVTSGPVLSKGGLGEPDALSLELLIPAAGWEAGVITAGYEQFKKISGYHSMWVETYSGDPDGDLMAVSINCTGLAANVSKLKRFISAAGQQISVGPIEKTVLVWSDDEQGEDAETGDPVDRVKRRVPKLDEEGEVVYKTITTPTGNAERWDVSEAVVEVRDRYLTTTEPATDVINTAMTPASAPTPPPFIWGGYTEPMRFRHPSGWVLVDRQIDRLFWDGSVGLWLVEDFYSYFYSSTPD